MRDPIDIPQEERPLMMEALKSLNLPCKGEFMRAQGQYPAKVGHEPETFVCDVLELTFDRYPTSSDLKALHSKFRVWDWDKNRILIRGLLKP